MAGGLKDRRDALAQCRRVQRELNNIWSLRYDSMLSDVTWRARVAREERERRRRDRIKAVVLFVVSTLFVLVTRYYR